MSLQGNNDMKESCFVCIPVPIMAWTNFLSVHWYYILLLAFDYRHIRTKGRVSVACLSFIFQVDGSVFLLGIKIDDDNNFFPFVLKGRFPTF